MGTKCRTTKKKRESVWDRATPAQRRKWASMDRADAAERGRRAAIKKRAR